MQYLVIVYDLEDAHERRMEARAEHIKATQSLMKTGKIISACAMVEDDKMIGSSIVTNFNNQEEFENWLANEPYVKNSVWNLEEIQIVDVKIMTKD